MTSVIWTYDHLGSYESPGDPWTEQEQLTYAQAFSRGYEDYKILQGVLAIMVCLFCKRRRYPKLAVPQALNGDLVTTAERKFAERDAQRNRYMAERFVLLLLQIDLPSALVLCNVIDHINNLIDNGTYTFEGETIFPLQSDLYNKEFLPNSGVIVWLLNNEYVGPLVSWRIAFYVNDANKPTGLELLNNIETAVFHNRQDISELILTIDNRYNRDTVNDLLSKYEGIIPDDETIPREDIEQNYNARSQYSSHFSFRNIGENDPFPDIRSPPPLSPLEDTHAEQPPSRSPTPFDDILAPSIVTPNVSPIYPLPTHNTIETPNIPENPNSNQNLEYNRATTGN